MFPWKLGDMQATSCCKTGPKARELNPSMGRSRLRTSSHTPPQLEKKLCTGDIISLLKVKVMFAQFSW